MTVEPFAAFLPFPTQHCVTGSMRHIYQLMGHDVSEELLLGLGAGVGFVYWQQKGQPPFLGGRANVGRRGEEGLEGLAGRRTGVTVTKHTTSSVRRAEADLVAGLTAGIPAMLQVDMGLLPYFNFPPGYHFGGHVIAVVGYDPLTRTALVCDRDVTLHPVKLALLSAARDSRFPPFPPHNASWTFQFTGQRPPRSGELRAAIAEAADAMVNPPIANLGVRGIRTAAARIPSWPSTMDGDLLREACRNGYIMIDATGGTGGGLFRYMYARFLEEAAERTGEPVLGELASRLHDAGDRWQDVATCFDKASRAMDPARHLDALPAMLAAVADAEQHVWQELLASSR